MQLGHEVSELPPSQSIQWAGAGVRAGAQGLEANMKHTKLARARGHHSVASPRPATTSFTIPGEFKIKRKEEGATKKKVVSGGGSRGPE